MQGKQTNGIPIGPDTSFLVAETILTCVDDELLSKTHPVGGFRFFDDYELVFSDLSSAENALATSSQRSSEVQPSAERKQDPHRRASAPLDISWRHRLRSFDLRTDASPTRCWATLTRSLLSSAMHPADAVVAYSVSRLESVALDDAAWELALNYFSRLWSQNQAAFSRSRPWLQDATRSTRTRASCFSRTHWIASCFSTQRSTMTVRLRGRYGSLIAFCGAGE